MYCGHFSVCLAAIIAGVAASTCTQAATVRAGSAVTVVRDVSSSLPGTSWDKKVEGDDVYESEFVRTAARSSAVISFVDETKISIGQAAMMKIDRVVLKSNRSIEELIVNAEAGAMRWNSGTSPSSAYQLKTPDAIIRPLGTMFDLLVESQRTMVVSRRGTIEVCSVGAPQRCRTLSQPGEMIIATPSGLEEPQRGGLGPSEFADQCLSADAIPCVITAGISPPKRHAQSSARRRVQASVPRKEGRGKGQVQAAAPREQATEGPGEVLVFGTRGHRVRVSRTHPHRAPIFNSQEQPPPCSANVLRSSRASSCSGLGRGGTGRRPPWPGVGLRSPIGPAPGAGLRRPPFGRGPY